MERPLLHESSGSQEGNIQNSIENEAVTEEPSRSRITVDFGFPMSTIIKRVFLKLFEADNTEYNVDKITLHISLITMFTITLVIIAYRSLGLSPDGDNPLAISVLIILTFVLVLSVFCSMWLVCSNRRQSNNLQRTKETPADAEIHPCFLNLVWDNKYGIKVIFVWIFGFGCILSSVVSLRAYTFCMQITISDRNLVIVDIIYHICFVIFIFSQLVFANYFANFQFTHLTKEKGYSLTILIAGMLSIWINLLSKMVSTMNMEKRSSLSMVNSTKCDYFTHQTYPWIPDFQELLQPALIGFSVMGIHLISKLFQNSNGTVDLGENIVQPGAGTESENYENTIARTDNSAVPNKLIDKRGRYMSLFFGFAWFLCLLVLSLLYIFAYKGDDYARIGIFGIIYRIFMIIFLVVSSKTLKRQCKMFRTSPILYGVENCFFLLCFFAVLFYHGLLFLDGIFLWKSHPSDFFGNDQIAISVIGNALLILWIHLQTIFIMKAEAYFRKGIFDTIWSIENRCTLLGIVNFGHWIFYAVAALPVAKVYLVKYRIPGDKFIDNLIYPFMILYFLIAWMKLRYISRRFEEEYLNSED